MKVIDLIQNMQAAIDALSYHSADTEVLIQAGSSLSLTGDIKVDDSTGNLVVTMEHKSSRGDWRSEFERLMGPRVGKSFDWSKVKITASQGGDPFGNIVADAAINKALPDGDDPIGVINTPGFCDDDDAATSGFSVPAKHLFDDSRASPEVAKATYELLLDDIMDLDDEDIEFHTRIWEMFR